jgi:hypothetical protein
MGTPNVSRRRVKMNGPQKTGREEVKWMDINHNSVEGKPDIPAVLQPQVLLPDH